MQVLFLYSTDVLKTCDHRVFILSSPLPIENNITLEGHQPKHVKMYVSLPVL